MLINGETIEKININKFIGDSVVIDFTKTKNKIAIEDFLNNNKKNGIRNKIKKNDIVLLKTRNKPLKKFNKNFTYLDKTGAKFLADKKIKCVGIDNFGIERNQPDHETHKILFRNKIPIVEGLELSKIRAGRYFFVGLPLKIKNADGAPVRAILVKF
jgi:arylformamidase